ncbi:MupA/Atu3671 family FMN-dependent luciferase-like monooxygenase [Nocardia jiangsuensis]|uniref:MupA/Atu3671 family FMN-dependent luciferase-like monooxygenase n=1 Tax=Nocardia jiangsuensis TaxID=1691563 RepID=A0ABV8DWM0_9NOCA
MEFSLFFFANNDADAGTNYALLLAAARLADQRGFTAVWTPERHFHQFGGAYPNPAVTGAALATATERIGIRAGSVVAPLHDPVRVAEEWSVVDNLSGGRAGVAFASGWHTDDFVLRPDGYTERRRITVETIETVRRLWRGEKITRRNGAGMPADIALSPRPVQPELPIWMTTAGSEETFRAAGAHGTFVLTHMLGQSVSTLRTRIEAYRSAYADGPGEQGTGTVTLMIHAYVDRDGDLARRLARKPFTDYLLSSWNLMSRLSDGVPQGELSGAVLDGVIARAADRYMTENGIFGTPQHAVDMLRELQAAGVDEVAFLVDFGLPADAVLRGLEYLAALRRLVR